MKKLTIILAAMFALSACSPKSETKSETKADSTAVADSAKAVDSAVVAVPDSAKADTTK